MVKIASKNKGFTLLETIMAVVIISVGMTAIISAYNTGILFSSDIENTDIALNIARQEMEEIKKTTFDSIVDAGPTSDDIFQDFDVEVVTSYVPNKNNKLKQVDVYVLWDAPGGGELNLPSGQYYGKVWITLTTLVADYVKK